ncbi:MAG: hypothetical protein ABIR62_00470 [Dokdonella sp.]|uniref:hypothetical protein n=1 Tax=Dokdonella sp. TaxID=2291710 RepID=UPI003263468E
MSTIRIIATVGVSEQEVAHLRLVLRQSATELDHVWRWGEEGGADLVIIDIGDFAGGMARGRAQSTGVRHAIFSESDVDGADLVLRRPLQRANVIDVFNRASAAIARNPQIHANTADFYTHDLGDEPGDSTRATRGMPVDRPDPIPGLDDLLRYRPVELRDSLQGAAFSRPLALEVVQPQKIEEPPPPPSPRAVAAPPNAPARTYASRDEMLEDTMPRALQAFLDVELLKVPSRFTLPGSPTLVVDPKNKVAYTAAGLGSLSAYCQATWRLCDWQALTTGELAEARESQTAQSYTRLVWLNVLLQSGGKLAPHLDPGGTYRLRHWVEIEKELSRYFRVASAMLQPARLHEIAATAAAPMADVFDLVNAYDAIGMIEWQPRARRDDEPAKKPPGLLARFRNPFGKS